MGKQPGRHTDWLCNGRGLSAATGTADGEVLTFAAGYGGRCQRRDTVSPGSEEPYFGGDQPGHICLRSQSSLAAKVMEMKLHRLRDVRSDYGSLKQHG